MKLTPYTTGRNPGVSIVIPCYNYAHFLSEAIDSCLAQTYDDFEIIIVNDGSTDNTQEIIESEKYFDLKPYPMISVKQENKGLSAARNAGINAARGEWILCLDADDKLDPDFLDLALGWKDADIVGTWQQEFGIVNRVQVYGDNPTHQDFLEYNRINCSCLFKKTMWQQLGGYDETMKIYEDWDFWLRATKKGYKVSVVPSPLLLYRIHPNSMLHRLAGLHDETYAYMLKKLQES